MFLITNYFLNVFTSDIKNIQESSSSTEKDTDDNNQGITQHESGFMSMRSSMGNFFNDIFPSNIQQGTENDNQTEKKDDLSSVQKVEIDEPLDTEEVSKQTDSSDIVSKHKQPKTKVDRNENLSKHVKQTFVIQTTDGEQPSTSKEDKSQLKTKYDLEIERLGPEPAYGTSESIIWLTRLKCILDRKLKDEREKLKKSVGETSSSIFDENFSVQSLGKVIHYTETQETSKETTVKKRPKPHADKKQCVKRLKKEEEDSSDKEKDD